MTQKPSERIKEISDDLFSKRTVEFHRIDLLDKYGTTNEIDIAIMLYLDEAYAASQKNGGEVWDKK